MGDDEGRPSCTLPVSLSQHFNPSFPSCVSSSVRSYHMPGGAAGDTNDVLQPGHILQSVSGITGLTSDRTFIPGAVSPITPHTSARVAFLSSKFDVENQILKVSSGLLIALFTVSVILIIVCHGTLFSDTEAASSTSWRQVSWKLFKVSWPGFLTPTGVALNGETLYVAAGRAVQSFASVDNTMVADGVSAVLPTEVTGLGINMGKLLAIGSGLFEVNLSTSTTSTWSLQAALTSSRTAWSRLYELSALTPSTAALLTLPNNTQHSIVVESSGRVVICVGMISGVMEVTLDLGISLTVKALHVCNSCAEATLFAATTDGILVLSLETGEELAAVAAPDSVGEVVAMTGNATHLLAIFVSDGNEPVALTTSLAGIL